MASPFTLSILEKRGFHRQADGSFSKEKATAVFTTKNTKQTKAKARVFVGREHPAHPAGSALAAKFEVEWREANGPELECEFRFHGVRKWRFDYVHHATKTAIEIDGGIFSNGRHNRGKGYQGDCEKINSAILLGYHVFRLTTGTVSTERVAQIIEHVRSKTPS